jgi:pseudaminic acid cytidylyltransferase
LREQIPVDSAEQKRIAIIPARGGSKRIPGKNIRSFHGRPILAYSIEAALHSNLFTEVMVSTDSKEIANIALEFGATVPFMRSSTNADDHATTADVLLEVLETYNQQGEDFNLLCCIYPTAVFVTPEKLRASLKKLEDLGVDSTLPIVQFGYPVQRGLRLIENSRIEYVAPENRFTRSQDLEPIYHDAGQFYWLRVAHFQSEKDLILEKNTPFEVSELEVQDIDQEVDWLLAEIKYSLMQDRL